MTRKIEVSDEVTDAINEIGGTFDTVDDVLRRVLDEAGYDVGMDGWEREALHSYFDDTTSTRQKVFLEALVEYGDEFAPKDEIVDRIDAAGKDVSGHTLDGVQSSLTRRCKSAGREKFWERRRLDGRWGYRIKAPYREMAAEYWGE